MSSEVETSGKDEEAKEEPKKTLKEKVQQNWQIGLKIIELLLCCLCLGFAFDAVQTLGMDKSDISHIGIMYTACTGYMLINITFLISRLMADTIPYKTSALFSICGASIFLITAVLLLVDRAASARRYSFNSNMSQLVLLSIASVFALINTAVFVADAVYTIYAARKQAAL